MPIGPWSAAFVAVGLAVPLILPAPMPGLSLHVPHAPILVDGDDGFTRLGSGVVAGSGRAGDPYIIEGWRVVPLAPIWNAAIELRNTTSHVVIRNVLIEEGVDGEGVVLRNVSNVRVANSSFYDVDLGVYIRSSRNIELQNLTIEGTASGVFASHSEGVSLTGIHVTCHPSTALPAAEFNNVKDGLIEESKLRCEASTGLRLWSIKNVSVIRNTVTDSTLGFEVDNATASVIAKNGVVRSRSTAFLLGSLDGFVVEDNSVQGCGSGIFLGIKDDAKLGGSFKRNTIKDTAWFPFWTKGYPSPYAIEMEANYVDSRPIRHFHGLINQVLHGNDTDAAFVIVSDATNVTITGWNVSSVTGWPLHVINGQNVKIVGNTFTDGGGIKMAYGAKNVLADNHFAGIINSAAWIGSLEATISRNFIKGNNIGIEFRPAGPGTPGRQPPVGQDSTVVGNVVDTPGYPLLIYQTEGVRVSNNTFGSGEVAIISGENAVLRHNNLLAGYLKAKQSFWPGPGFSFDARFNWWGSEEGPGEHDTQSNHEVTFSDQPWLTEPANVP